MQFKVSRWSPPILGQPSPPTHKEENPNPPLLKQTCKEVPLRAMLVGAIVVLTSFGS